MNEDTLMIEGLDDCLIGTCMTWHGNMLVERHIYDGIAIVAHYMSEDGMTEEEAFEYVDFNIVGAYAGETMPIVMWPVVDEETE